MIRWMINAENNLWNLSFMKRACHKLRDDFIDLSKQMVYMVSNGTRDPWTNVNSGKIDRTLVLEHFVNLSVSLKG